MASFRRNEQDLAAGVLFTLTGAIGFAASFRYTMGSAVQMGPGYFPALVFGALGLVGLVILGRAFLSDGERLERWAWRPLLVVMAALVIFGLGVEMLGFVVSAGLLVIVSTVAGAQLSWLQVALLALFLTVFCALVFLVGLGLPIPVWPDFPS